jgi:phosphoglycolate phosphatase
LQLIVSTLVGTLGDCTPALKAWSQKMTNNIIKKCLNDGLSTTQTQLIVSQFHQAIGWDATIDNVLPSAPLSAGTWDGIVELSAEGLMNAGLEIEIDQVREWHENLGDIHASDAPLISHLPDFLKHFKHHGIMISICTSDDRRSTNACMENWNIQDLIDYSICGDEVVENKPSAHPLMELCGRAGIMPHECMVVGDTSADTQMGRNSKAGLIVGVLTGSGTERQLLDTGAHIILPNISYIKDLLESHDVFTGSETGVDSTENVSLSPIKIRAG